MRGSLRVILSDQLNVSMSSLSEVDKAKDTILLCELLEELTRVRHHKKKIAFLLAAMRHFGAELVKKGYVVRYVKLDDPKNAGSLRKEVARAVSALRPAKIVIAEPSEWHIEQEVGRWEKLFKLPVDLCADDRFLCKRAEFAQWAKGRKEYRMEFFYREMRKRYGLLMKGKEPEGGEVELRQ